MNVIVISLKDEFYAHSDALIGVCPDNANGERFDYKFSTTFPVPVPFPVKRFI